MFSEKKFKDKIEQLIDPESLVLIGLGNIDRADDGAGIQIVSKIKARFPEQAFLETEQSVEGLVFDCLENKLVGSVIFIDAVDFKGNPGQVEIFTTDDIERFSPAISTHKVPIGFLMELIQQSGRQSLLIGIQPKSLVLMGKTTAEIDKVIGQVFQIFNVLLTK